MKYRVAVITAVLFLLGGAGAAFGAADNNAPTAAGTATVEQPSAEISHLNYKFDAVVDGAQVTHDFAVKNTGKGVLEISRVKTG
jgi:hypothetical protein